MTYEYTWCALEPDRLTQLGREGWRLVPNSIRSDHLALMERKRRVPAHRDKFPFGLHDHVNPDGTEMKPSDA